MLSHSFDNIYCTALNCSRNPLNFVAETVPHAEPQSHDKNVASLTNRVGS